MFVRDDSGEIAVLRLAHGKVNTLDVALCEGIVEALRGIAASPPRALVITGTGSAFSAGVDLFQVIRGGADYVSRFLPALDAMYRALLEFPKPAVAAINGHAIAGGCLIAAACDHRIMSEGTARIGIPELAVGVPFPPMLFELMRARVSAQTFRRLVFSARTVEPSDALRFELIDEMVPAAALLSRAREVAGELARVPAVTFALTKRAFAASILERVHAAAAINAEAVAAWGSPAVQARIREYVETTIGKK
jgi:enoyl-CoA hydratase